MNGLCVGMEQVAGIVGAFVTWVLVVAGWIVVNDQAKHREMAKASLVKMDQLRLLLDKLEEHARQLHTSEYDELKVKAVHRAMKKIAIECNELDACGVLDKDWRRNNIALRQAITLSNCDRSSFLPQPMSSELLTRVEVAKDNFDEYLARRGVDWLASHRSLWASLNSVFWQPKVQSKS